MILSKATICLQMIAKRNQQFTNRDDFVKKILICFILLLKGRDLFSKRSLPLFYL